MSETRIIERLGVGSTKAGAYIAADNALELAAAKWISKGYVKNGLPNFVACESKITDSEAMKSLFYKYVIDVSQLKFTLRGREAIPVLKHRNIIKAI
jgi:hypothetical protein